jgi:ABC-2 type transport system permease protein
MFIPTVGMLVGILYMNQKQSAISDMSQLKDQQVISILKPFHQLIVAPFSLDALIGFLIIVALVALFGMLIKEKTLPKIRNQVTTNTQKKKKTVYKSLRKQLISYHFSLIKNPTLQLQILSGLFIFPIVIIFPFFANGTEFLAKLGIHYFALFFVMGIIFAIMTLGINSLASVIISLDQDNLMFIKSLPISFKNYIKLKYYFAFAVQFVSLFLIMLVGGLMLKLSIILIIALIFGAFMGCLVGTSLT